MVIARGWIVHSYNPKTLVMMRMYLLERKIVAPDVQMGSSRST